MNLQFAPSAQQDLEDIGDYIHLENPDAARRLIAELRVKCRRLADVPRMGVARPELGNAVRSFPFRRYIIFYSIIGNTLRIERILHGSRDIEAAFEE
jgi:toxin ParE1/3/4